MLEISGLCARYGKLEVLRNVSISVSRGEVVGLLGANNAGKTTVVNCVSGIVRPSAGRFVFEGSDISRLEPHEIAARGICQVPEGRQLFPRMTVWENLLLGGFTRGARSRRSERAAFVMDLFPRLKERRKQLAGTLSGGEQQMLAIGRALMAGPKLLMLDEPSLGLSPLFVLTIFEALSALHREGLTILLVEQNLKIALNQAQRCYVLERGEVVISGDSQSMRHDPAVRRAYLGA
jgi:branched-chain amino acid transport system ATP-binding protein